MSAAKCHYCDKGEAMDAIGLEVAKLSVSTLYIFREQSHPGRCIVALNEHIGDVADLSDDQRNAFFADVAKAARALYSAYNPDKINYATFGDTLKHLHFHLVPKYKDGFEWGGTFAMNPQQVTLSDAEYQAAITKIKAAL